MFKLLSTIKYFLSNNKNDDADNQHSIPPSIADFWTYFIECESQIYNEDYRVNPDVCDKLSHSLQLINEGLHLNISVSRDNTKCLTFKTDRTESAFEDVKLIYHHKPAVKGWKIIKFGQPLENVIDWVLKYQDVEIELDQVFFDLQTNELGVGVILFVPDYDQSNIAFEHLKLMILDACLGEYDAVTKVRYCQINDLTTAADLILDDVNLLKTKFDLLYKSIVQ